MRLERWRSPLTVLVAAAGLADSVYLTIAHYADAPLACANTGAVNCDLVTRSSYGTLGETGVPVSLTGVAWFAVALAIALWLWLRPGLRPALALLGWSAIGIAVVVYLVYVELVRLHHLCEWCTGVHLAVAVLLLLAISSAQDSPRRAAEA